MIPALPPRGMRNRRVVTAHILNRYASSLVSEVHKHAILTGAAFYMFKAAMSSAVSCSEQWKALVSKAEESYTATASELASMIADNDKLREEVRNLREQLRLEKDAARKRLDRANEKAAELERFIQEMKEEVNTSASNQPKRIRAGAVTNGR